MLSPEYRDLTGNDQLNVAKSKLNKVKYSNVHKNYELKKELENISDITQIDPKGVVNPFFIEKDKDINNKTFNTVSSLFEKLRAYYLNFLGLFSYGKIGVQTGQRLNSVNEITKLKTNYNHITSTLSLMEKELNKIQVYPALISKDNNKMIDTMISELKALKVQLGNLFKLDTRPTILPPGGKKYIKNPNYNKYIDNIIFPATGMSDENKKLITDMFVTMYMSLLGNTVGGRNDRGLLQHLEEISKLFYEAGLNLITNMARAGNGISGGNLWNPKLYPDIPSKYK